MLRSILGLFRPYQNSELEKKDLKSRLNALCINLDPDELLREWLRDAEGKSAVYLGHISIMIAVAGVFAATVGEKGPYLRLAFGIELIAYLLLALLCLRAQMNLGQYVFAKVRERKEMRMLGLQLHGFENKKPPEEVTVGKAEVFNEFVSGEVVFRERLVHVVMIGLWILTLGLVVLVSISMDLYGAVEMIIADSPVPEETQTVVRDVQQSRLPRLPKAW